MKKIYYYLFILLLSSFSGFSQEATVVKGVIRDKQTKEPVPFASVMFVNSTVGANSDFEGQYRLITNVAAYTRVKFSFVGYKTLVIAVKPGKEQVIDILLEQEAAQLKEVNVKAGKIKYRNKNNEAVELINKVIENKPRNQPRNYDYLEYEKYEKIQFALSNVSEKFKDKAPFKNFKFIFEGVDTTKFKGKPVLPVYMKETLSDVYYRKQPEKEKQVVKADKMVSFEGYINNDGVDNYLKNLYQHIDIYENDIMLLTNQFLSPIAQNAPLFYKFVILDTLVVNEQKLINLGFLPRNPNDFMFQGNLYVTLDSAYAVKKLDMTVNRNINLNWVKELKIRQEFDRDEAGRYFLVMDDFMSDFGVLKSTPGIFGQKTVSYKNIIVNEPRSAVYYEGLPVEVKAEALTRSEDFWMEGRHQALNAAESGVYSKIDSVKKNRSFRRILNIATPFMIGYRAFGPVEMGPVNTFISFNPVEGFRLRFGGRTTPMFSKKVMLDTYAAYGFRDEAWKYYLGFNYSFTDKTIFDFPVKSLKVSYQKDTKIAGQNLQEDNFFLSFKRGTNDNWTYNDIFNIEYLNEYHNHFSFLLGYKNWTQYPAGTLRFNVNDYNDKTGGLGHITTSEFSANVRWAPGEQFYQAKLYRISIYNRFPVFSLTYSLGLKDVFGGEHNYQNINFTAFKRFYLSQIGYTNVLLEGGQLIGSVPFPLLTIHRANQSYAFQYRSYNLMNFLEFVSDRYVAVTADHFFNGFFFNKIPLMKKLKWREVASLKLLYGDLRRENNPVYNQQLLQFPQLADGTPIMQTFENKPYVEGSVGVANVFKFLRVDLVKRFNYLDHPNIASLGVRASFKFDF